MLCLRLVSNCTKSLKYILTSLAWFIPISVHNIIPTVKLNQTE